MIGSCTVRCNFQSFFNFTSRGFTSAYRSCSHVDAAEISKTSVVQVACFEYAIARPPPVIIPAVLITCLVCRVIIGVLSVPRSS